MLVSELMSLDRMLYRSDRMCLAYMVSLKQQLALLLVHVSVLYPRALDAVGQLQFEFTPQI